MKKIVKDNLYTNNWFNFQEFYTTVSKEDWNVFIEIGVWKGHSISFLADKLRGKKDISIYAVDLFEETYRWSGENGDSNIKKQVPHIYDIYQQVLKETNTRHLIEDIKSFSWRASEFFEDKSVDFVFIDADHSYESVKKDIIAWLPKVRSSGMISGHDYFTAPGVRKAVTELLPESETRIHHQSGTWSFRI